MPIKTMDFERRHDAEVMKSILKRDYFVKSIVLKLIRGKWRLKWVSSNSMRPKKVNPLFSFKKFYVTCDGKKFGPFTTQAKAKKVAETVTRVLDKPARIMGAATNPKRKATRKANPKRKAPAKRRAAPKRKRATATRRRRR